MTAVKTSRFQAVLASVESLPTDDQAILAEVVTKRVAAMRRRQLVKEIGQAEMIIAGARCIAARRRISFPS